VAPEAGGELMERVPTWIISAARYLLNSIYKLFDTVCPRGNYVVFLSRQASTPSYDFSAIGEALEKRGYQCVYLVKKLKTRNAIPYALFALKSLYWLARCRACILDRYNPLVSMIDFKCEDRPTQEGAEGVRHLEFPCEPVVVQIWHAFGAFKKFGYQSIGTREGHSESIAREFDIHRNYSWILCTGEGARKAYAEAFSYPLDRIVALGRPEYDKLLMLTEKKRVQDRGAGGAGKARIIIAPTLRKDCHSSHPLRRLYDSGALSALDPIADIHWSFHPLDDRKDAPGAVNEGLLAADYVVTDYSSIVYEAWILNKKVLFYAEDIDEYIESPGLFSNPIEICPSLVATNEGELVEKVSRWISGGDYPQNELDRFVSGMVDERLSNAAESIALFVEEVSTIR